MNGMQFKDVEMILVEIFLAFFAILVVAFITSNAYCEYRKKDDSGNSTYGCF